MAHPINPGKQGLYDPRHEHDACGVGFLVDLKNRKSHDVVEKAIQILLNLAHRGACGCEPNTGDGAGILLQTPHRFLTEECKRLGFTLPSAGQYGVAMVFLPTDARSQTICERLFELVVREEGQTVLGWRTVPSDASPLGATAKAVMPVIRQLFIGRSADLADDHAFERKLYVIRRRIENLIKHSIFGPPESQKFYDRHERDIREEVAALQQEQRGMFYVPSLSCRNWRN